MRETKTACVLLILVGLFLHSCMLLSPVKRQPLTINEYRKDIQLQNKEIIVCFKSVVPGKPLDETIWDNMHGAIWDIKESQQIGFTQHYVFTPVPIPGAATVATSVKGTRIVVPFGNVFVSVFKSAIGKSFYKSTVCLNEGCVENNKNDFNHIITIEIDEFRVYESPMNHINFHLQVTSRIHDNKGNKLISKTTSYELKELKLGSILNTSYSFIDKMNAGINEFTEDAVHDLIVNVISPNL